MTGQLSIFDIAPPDLTRWLLWLDDRELLQTPLSPGCRALLEAELADRQLPAQEAA